LNHRRILLVTASMLVAVFSSSTRAALEPPAADRLATLATVWGAVKYRHPRPDISAREWDSALLQTLPDVRRAQSDDEYVSAVGKMLSALNDPVTTVARAQPDSPGSDANAAGAQQARPAVRIEDSTVVIDCLAAAGSGWAPGRSRTLRS
jgi:hypothetical protein